jgi:hypothetical protein
LTTLSEKKEELDRTIKGFLVPIFSEIAENGGQRNLLSEQDFDKVVAGYACSECLAEFVTYMVKCPVCAHRRNPNHDIEHAAPQMWKDHLRDRAEIEAGEKRAPRVVPEGIDGFIRSVREDPDIEQIRL